METSCQDSLQVQEDCARLKVRQSKRDVPENAIAMAHMFNNSISSIRQNSQQSGDVTHLPKNIVTIGAYKCQQINIGASDVAANVIVMDHMLNISVWF